MLPYLIHIGRFSLPTFGALAALGLMAALWLSQFAALRVGLAPQKLWDAGLFAVLATYLLSRGLLLPLHWRAFLVSPLSLLAAPSLTAPGLLLSVILTSLWLRWKRVDVLRAIDAWAPCATLVWAFLALGHLAEGSDPGMICRWGIRMPGDAVRTHPVVLYVIAVAGIITGAAYRLLRAARPRGEVAGLTLACVGASQFLLSFLRLPGIHAGWGLDLLQWVALGMLLTGGALYVLGMMQRVRARIPSDLPRA